VTTRITHISSRSGRIKVRLSAAKRSRRVRSPPRAGTAAASGFGRHDVRRHERPDTERQRLRAALAGRCSTTTRPGFQEIPASERRGANGSAARCQATARLSEISAASSG
jgi:hypothetical protein